jgi:DNA-binding transcriptional LysR family regulator
MSVIMCGIYCACMTLTQLNVFVLVARLGSVTAAANALSVSESAVSQALTALRQHLGDQLVVRGAGGMTLTPGGSRLLATASQIVALGAEAQAAVRAAQGAPEQLRLVATSTIAEFAVSPVLEAFTRRFSGAVEVSSGVAMDSEMAVLVANRLADLALGSPVSRAGRDGRNGRAAGDPREAREAREGRDQRLELVCEPVFRYKMIVVAGAQSRPHGGVSQWMWLVDPSGTDPGSDSGTLLRTLRVPENRIRVFPNQTAAWAAAADGAGVAPAASHLVSHQLRRGELSVVSVPGTPMDACWHVTTLQRDRRSPAASSLRHFLGTPEAMHLMRSPTEGMPPSRFRPPVYVTIWS